MPADPADPADPAARLAGEQWHTQARLALLRGDHDAFVAASLDSNADDEHDPEGATIAFERAQVEALTRQALTHLDEIQSAFERVEAGTYGSCERCGRQIPSERLEIRPTARRCTDCASRALRAPR